MHLDSPSEEKANLDLFVNKYECYKLQVFLQKDGLKGSISA